jgi:hypothetical protein
MKRYGTRSITVHLLSEPQDEWQREQMRTLHPLKETPDDGVLKKLKAAILSYPGNHSVTVQFLTNGEVTAIANQRLTHAPPPP